jgi:hypothetical protein
VGGFGAEVGVPPPPPGPGVAPPFAAPPSERSRKRMWIGLGVAGLVLVVCCAGGLFGVGVYAVANNDLASRQATTVVTQYLDALHAEDYRTAQAKLCDDLAQRTPVAQVAEQARREPFTAYRLDPPQVAQTAEVTAHLTGPDGQPFTHTYTVEPADTGEWRICGIR